MNNNKIVGLAKQSWELTLPNLTGEMSRLWQNAKVRAILQILFLLSMGGVAAWAKSVGLPLGIPGSNGVLWLAPLVAGCIITNKRGAGVFMGMSMAAWGIPMGINHEFIYNFCLYGIAGLTLDLAAMLPLVNIRNPFGAIFCGVLAHMVKYLFIMQSAYIGSVVRDFMFVGLDKAALLHLAFGAAAGLLGWIAYNATNGKDKKQKDPDKLTAGSIA
jgi:hypothetical protein